MRISWGRLSTRGSTGFKSGADAAFAAGLARMGCGWVRAWRSFCSCLKFAHSTGEGALQARALRGDFAQQGKLLFSPDVGLVDSALASGNAREQPLEPSGSPYRHRTVVSGTNVDLSMCVTG